MACNKNSNRCADAARRNGIAGQVSRYLNTIGSWSTYRDLGSVGEIPERIAQATAAFFGIKGLIDGHPRLAGALGVIIGVHALEHVTGGIATTAMRLYGRGQPLVNYRGILVRKSPFAAKVTSALNRLSGGRVLDAKGYYFFESGKTWHCQSMTVQLGDMPKTLTKVQSYSIPHREFYFDRPIFVPEEEGHQPEAGQKVIHIQRVIDTVMGDDNPDAIPGFIGSVNELEDISGSVGNLKRVFFMTNWLLLDEGERDGGSSAVDYEALVKGTPPGGSQSGGGVYQVSRSPSPGGSGTPSFQSPVRTIPAYPSISRASATPPPPPASPYEAELLTAKPKPVGALPTQPPPYGANLFGSASAVTNTTAQSIGERYRDRIKIGHKEYPLVVKRVVATPFGDNMRRADAIYYDDEVRAWRVVDDDEDRLNLAKAVDEERLAVTPMTEWPATSY